MSVQRSLVAVTVVLLAQTEALAQDTAKSSTKMILGAAPSFAGVPAYTVGVEFKPASSRVSWRLMSEFWERSWRFCSGPTSCDEFNLGLHDSFRRTTTFGIQALGIMPFNRRRVQPYLFAGAALYSVRELGYRPQFGPDSAVVVAAGVYDRTEIRPTLIWGTGLNVRLWKANMFGEVKLPLPSTRGGIYPYGPYSPLMFGLRF
jgi:hypothetical protein